LWMGLMFPLGPDEMLIMQSGGAREARSTTRGFAALVDSAPEGVR